MGRVLLQYSSKPGANWEGFFRLVRPERRSRGTEHLTQTRMKGRFVGIWLLGVMVGTIFVAHAENPSRGIPQPLPSHPGNIFVSGERIIISEPPGEDETWRLTDYEGK